MKLEKAGLSRQPFQVQGTPLTVVTYESQKAAIRFLSETRLDICGLGLFHGPPLSGKTTIIRQFTAMLPPDYAVAVADATGMSARSLLQDILAQFGYEIGLESASECFSMVRMVATQQAATGNAPLLIIENVHAARPALLEMLCELAELTANGKSALRMILVSDRPMLPIVQAPAMEPISQRLTGQFLLQPMTQQETMSYVYRKLESGGCSTPRRLMPPAACHRLHTASGGWPGVVDRLALVALSKARRCPIGLEHIPGPPANSGKVATIDPAAPQLLVTCAGKTLKRTSLTGTRLTIGRDELCELHIRDHYSSRQHAILFRNGTATIIVDLKSRNGTYVNGKPVGKQVLINNDIIAIGDHRIKFVDASAKRRTTLQRAGWDDTTIAKSMKEFRSVLALRLGGRNSS